jgi:hypothetical protein
MEFGLGILPENYRVVSLTWGRNPAPRRAVSDSDQKLTVRNRTLLYRKLQREEIGTGVPSPFSYPTSPADSTSSNNAP